jgi:hypothetical protein
MGLTLLVPNARIRLLIQHYKYVPFSLFYPLNRCSPASSAALVGDCAAQDHADDLLLSLTEWRRAFDAIMPFIKTLQGADRATDLQSHIEFVMGLDSSMDTARVLLYDQRRRIMDELQIAEQCEGIDFSVPNEALVAQIQRDAIEASYKAHLLPSSGPSRALDRPPHRPTPYPSTSAAGPSRSSQHPKPSDGFHCFRCGYKASHFPAECTAGKSIAGVPCLALAPSASNRNILCTKEGRQICAFFSSKGVCRRAACEYLHICSICLSSDHGAKQCTKAEG